MNYILFCFFVGGGGGRRSKKYVWRYDEIMIITFWGVIFINLGLFKVKVQIWKNVFGVAKFQIIFGYA